MQPTSPNCGRGPLKICDVFSFIPCRNQLVHFRSYLNRRKTQ
jgi:hypothetical protein